MDSFVILALLLSVPVAILSIYILREGGLDKDWKTTISFFMAIVLGSCTLTLLIGEGSKHLSTRDVEIISGQITNKERVNGHYVRTYQCNCTTDSKGNRSCQTCREDRYTVKWTAVSTVGSYTIESLNKSSKRVWLTPDPERYVKITIGDPAAAEHSYKNYVLGMPEEYSQNRNLGASAELIAKIPAYPKVFDFYNVNRVLNIDGLLTSEKEVEYNKVMANKLKTLGPSKEVNILLVVGKADENLMYAIREKWNGVKKNDVVVVVGLEDNRIKTVNVLTFAKNELFKIRLQDRIDENKTLDGLLEIVFNEIESSYERPRMRDYEEMEMYLQTPMWALVLIYVLLFGIPVGIVVSNKFQR